MFQNTNEQMERLTHPPITPQAPTKGLLGYYQREKEMKAYVYDTGTDEIVAIITGDSSEACQSKAEELNYMGSDEYALTYSPAFGTNDAFGPEQHWPLAYSVPKGAEAMGLSPPHVWREIASGKLASVKVGKRRLLLPEDMKAYLMARRVPQSK